MPKSRKCVVCGALFKSNRRASNHNTCDPLCTRAKHAKRTREEQTIWETEQEFLLSDPYDPLYDPDNTEADIYGDDD